SSPALFETSHTTKDGHEILMELSGVKFELQAEIFYYGVARDITKRKEIEEELKSSEERFKLAVEGTNDGLWDWDLKTDYTYHSARFATMLGYEPQELPYTIHAWKDLLHPDDIDEAQKKVDEYLSGKIKIYKSTFRMLCKDGYYRWITGRGKALWDEKGEPYRFIGFNTDITTRKNAEKEFIKSQENYHRLYDTLSEGVMFFNQKAQVIDANPAAQKILDFSLNEIRGKNSDSRKWKTFHEDGSEYSIEEEPIFLSLSQGKYCQNVLIGFIDSGSEKTIWLSVNSAPIYENDSDQPSGAYSIFSDVTERKQVEDEFKKTNETLIAAQDMANIGYWTCVIKTGNLTWSKQMYTIFGLDPDKDAPTYEQHINIIHADDWEMFDESVKKCREGVPNNLNLKINFPDGSIHHVITQGFPRYNKNGEIYEIFGTTLDVTEFKLKEIELELNRNNLELLVQERTEKLEKQNKDLRHYHELFIGREFRIKELKDEIQALKEEVYKNKSIT
ncbi:MAG: PAS domain S-box protein, partial [Candidatus Stygibacter frigidus]|nr:PAS domain S-box protein [Candidatus Stygibacter frigidus]